MNKLIKYKFTDLYTMSSGLSSSKIQAGHGSQFITFRTVFNNYFIPDEICDLMSVTEKELETYSIKENDILLTRTSETINELVMSCVALKDYPDTTYSGFTKRLRPKQNNIVYNKYIAFYLRSQLFRKTIYNNTIMTLKASFNEDIFSFLDLYLPIYPQQQKIGYFLYNIHKKIIINNKVNDNLPPQSMMVA